MQFTKTWIAVVVVMFVLDLTYAVFSPVVHGILNDMVLIHLYNAQQMSLANNPTDVAYYYNSLNTARAMTVMMFDIFPWILTAVVLFWGIVQSLRREEDEYR
jgi:hypothetical protein